MYVVLKRTERFGAGPFPRFYIIKPTFFCVRLCSAAISYAHTENKHVGTTEFAIKMALKMA